jgi:hypothetical protein
MKFTVVGQTLFRPHVKHPGQRATFWFTRGVRAGIPAAQAQIERRIREGLGG